MKNDPLLLEIQDEISRENMVRFVNKYGKLLVIVGIVIFISIAAYQFWDQYRREEAKKTGSEISAIQQDMDKPFDEFTLKKLDQTAKTSGYYEISMLNKAHLQIKNNDIPGAITSFDAAAKNGSDKALRDLAAINAANLLLNTNPHAEGLETRLTSITGEDASFKYSARELLAAFYLANNNAAKATEILQALSKDPAVPVSISKRSRELLAGLTENNDDEAEHEED